MAKSLTDCCLHVIALNINCFSELGECLTARQKETLLRRMCVHQQLTPERISLVKKFLFTCQLRKLELCNTENVTNGFLISLSKHASRCQEIMVDNCKRISDEGLLPLLKTQPNLKSLSLKNLPNVVGTCLSSVQSIHLKSLVLRNLSMLKDQYVVQIVSNSSAIQHLDLEYCRELTDATIIGISAILKHNLVTLKLSGNSLITDLSLLALSKNNKNLKDLKLYGLNKLTEHEISRLLSSIELYSIDISYTCGYNTSSCCLPAETFSSSLQTFVSCGVQVQRGFFYELVDACPKLTTLDLCGMDAVDDINLKHIVKLLGHQLKRLDLSYCRNITDNGINAVVKHCTMLEDLSLQFYHDTALPLQDYAKLEKRKQALCLKKLFLPGCWKLNSTILKDILPNLSNLEELNIASVPGVGDEVLQTLSVHCLKLKHINLKGCKEISDVGVCPLIRACKFENIVLSGVANITDLSILTMANVLANCLKNLYLSGCSLISPHVLRYLKDVSVDGVYVQHRAPNVAYGQMMAKNLDTGEFCRGDLI